MRWKPVEDGWIYYDVNSGETKLLEPIAHFLIELLERSAQGLAFDEIVDRLASEEPEASRIECCRALEEVLPAMVQSSLIDTASIDCR